MTTICPAYDGSLAISWYPVIHVLNTTSPQARPSSIGDPARIPSKHAPVSRHRRPRTSVTNLLAMVDDVERELRECVDWTYLPTEVARKGWCSESSSPIGQVSDPFGCYRAAQHDDPPVRDFPVD